MSQDTSTPAMNRPCTRCFRYRIRPVEDIAAELYAAPSEARTFGGSEGWELLELIAMQLAEEIRGICAACHADSVLATKETR